jgi:hypothetical protein
MITSSTESSKLHAEVLNRVPGEDLSHSELRITLKFKRTNLFEETKLPAIILYN